MSDSLILGNNFSDADAFYAALTDMHRDLDRDQSERANARLILILANQVGDLDILQQAMSIASNLSDTSETATTAT